MNPIESLSNMIIFVPGTWVWSVSYGCGHCCQKQVSQAGISNCIPQYSVGCNYLSLPEIPDSGTKVLICQGICDIALNKPCTRGFHYKKINRHINSINGDPDVHHTSWEMWILLKLDFVTLSSVTRLWISFQQMISVETQYKASKCSLLWSLY